MDIEEGGVELEVPEQPDVGAGDAVFFNTDQELNRDLTVAVLRAFREREDRAETYLDAMAASGARGVRAAADGWTVTCCDVEADAVALCRANLDRNGLKGDVVERDVNALMHDDYFDVVDLDPFGSPMPFADAAFANTRDLVCVTATDTAPLCGAHFEAGVRRYSCVPRNTEYHAEMGLRVLVSALVRSAARWDVGVTPIFSHVTDHYARTYLELDHRATDADAAIGELGYVHHCQHCLYRETERTLVPNPPRGCPHCEQPQIVSAGPVWLGATHDRTFVAAVRERIPDSFGTAERARGILDTIEGEAQLPFHYDQHRLYKRWGESAIGMDDFLAVLRDAGFEATRTHYGGTTLKTDASVGDLADLFADQSE